MLKENNCIYVVSQMCLLKCDPVKGITAFVYIFTCYKLFEGHGDSRFSIKVKRTKLKLIKNK